MDVLVIYLCLATTMRIVCGTTIAIPPMPTTQTVPEDDIEDDASQLRFFRLTDQCTVTIGEKGSLTEPKQFKCMCDIECVRYGDCCIDYMVRLGLHTREITPPLTCVAPSPLSPFNLRFLNRRDYGYFMVARYTGRDGRVQKCNTTRFLPVSCRSTSKTYVNMECAFLNKVVDCTNWAVDSECNTYTSDPTKHSCKTNLVAPYFVDLRYCDSRRYSEIVSECPPNYEFQNDIRRCSKFFYPVLGLDGKVYRNMYCYICNGNFVSLVKSERNKIILALTDFSDEFERSTKKCDGKTSWMDNKMNKCRPIKCYTNKLLKGGECEYENRTAFGNPYHLAMKLNLETPHQISFYSQLVKNVIHDLAFGLQTNDYHLTTSEQIYFNQSSHIYVNMLFVITDENLSLETFEEDMMDNIYLRFLRLYIPVEINYTSVSRPYQVFKSYTFNRSVEICCSDSENLVDEETYEPISYQINCSYIEFDHHEFDIKGFTAYIPHLNISFEFKTFSIYKDRLRVCFRYFLRKINSTYSNETVEYSETMVTDNTDVAGWYIYIVCISLSLLGLVLTFITYLRFPELRTQPGKNNMALILTLFFAQLALVVGLNRTDDTVICPYIGMLIHYLWLSMILWMNVCSYHMFKVFVMRTLVRASESRNSVQSLIYSVYANGSPVLIVAATVVTNRILTEGKEIGYGGQVCYLNRDMVAYCFVVPLALVIVGNIVFFLWTVITIQRIDKVTREGRSSDRHNVFIYVRLSVLTGVFWLVSILTNVVSGVYLEYIAIILNASQGVFLFCSLVLNKTVISKWRRVISGQEVSIDRTSSTRQTSVSKVGTSFH